MTYPTAERMAACRAKMAEFVACGVQSSTTMQRLWQARSPLHRSPPLIGWRRRAAYFDRRDAKRRRHVAIHRSIATGDRRALQLTRRCAYCYRLCDVVIDHIVPVSRGGTKFLWNLAPACWSCNASKSDMTLHEWSSTEYYESVVRPRRQTIENRLDRFHVAGPREG